MDFDIGTFIYILLTLLFIIIGSLGSRKKSKQTPQDASSNSDASSAPESDPLSENLRKIFGDYTTPEENGNKYADETIESVEEEDHILDSPEDRLDNAKDFLEKPGNEVGSDKVYKLEDHIQDIMKDTSVKMRLKSRSKTTFVKKAFRDFDPRKGILYTEVFKPKYF